MQLFVVPRSIPSTFAIIFFSTFFRPPWATQDLSKDRAKRLEIAPNPNFQGKYAVTHDTPATLVATNCHIVADLFMLAFHRAALFRATVLALREWPIPASFAPLGVYIYAVGGESCRNRLTREGSARLRPKTKPRSASSGKSATPPARCIHRQQRDTSSAEYRLLVSRASCGASRELSSRRSPAHVPHTCAVSPTFRCGAFLFVVFALADLSSARLTTCDRNTTRSLVYNAPAT